MNKKDQKKLEEKEKRKMTYNKNSDRKRLNLSKERYLLFVDIETIGSIYYLDSCLPFDISYKVYDNINRTVVEEHCILIKRFFNNQYIMYTSFSGSKYDLYKQKLNDRELVSKYSLNSPTSASQRLAKVIQKYNIGIMVGHNAKFDYTTLNKFYNEFRAYNPIQELDILDTIEIAKKLTNSKEYKNFCKSNKDILDNTKKSRKLITDSGRVRTTAEAIYCFISNNPDYVEEHTGLQDIDIEIAIYNYCIDRYAIKRANLNISPSWREYDTVADRLEIIT